jgi:hypothetical protein
MHGKFRSSSLATRSSSLATRSSSLATSARCAVLQQQPLLQTSERPVQGLPAPACAHHPLARVLQSARASRPAGSTPCFQRKQEVTGHVSGSNVGPATISAPSRHQLATKNATKLAAAVCLATCVAGNMMKMRLAVTQSGFIYGCTHKDLWGPCPRTPCLLCDSLRSPGAPRPTYRHLAIHIATRRYKLIQAKTLA